MISNTIGWRVTGANPVLGTNYTNHGGRVKRFQRETHNLKTAGSTPCFRLQFVKIAQIARRLILIEHFIKSKKTWSEKVVGASPTLHETFIAR